MGFNKAYFLKFKGALKNVLVDSNLKTYDIENEIRSIPWNKKYDTEKIVIPERQKIDDIINEEYSNIEILALVQWILKIKKDGYRGRFFKIPGIDKLEAYFTRPVTPYNREPVKIEELMSANTEKDFKNILDRFYFPPREDSFNIFLKADIVGSTKFIETHGDTKSKEVFQAVHKAVSKICSKRSGEEIAWRGDGGTFKFQLQLRGDDMKQLCENAVLSGLSMHHWLHEYNLFDNRLDELDEEIVMRVIVIDSPQNEDLESIAKKINELEKDRVDPGTVAVSESIYSNLSEKLKKQLTYSFFLINQQKRFYEYGVALDKAE